MHHERIGAPFETITLFTGGATSQATPSHALPRCEVAAPYTRTRLSAALPYPFPPTDFTQEEVAGNASGQSAGL